MQNLVSIDHSPCDSVPVQKGNLLLFLFSFALFRHFGSDEFATGSDGAQTAFGKTVFFRFRQEFQGIHQASPFFGKHRPVEPKCCFINSLDSQ